VSLTARDFLSRVLPWPPQGDANAYYNVHWTFTPRDQQGSTRYPFTGRAVHTLDEAVDAVKLALWEKGSGRDVYVCMSSQRLAEQKLTANGNSYYKPQRSQAAAVELRSLFIDVDVKDGAYATTADAIAALQTFQSKSGMPCPTLVVSTGSGGFHAHWVLSKPLKQAHWQVLANALAAATKHHGFITDAGVTVDAARILRIPGTFNHKNGKKPVTGRVLVDHDYDAQDLFTILQPFVQATPALKTVVPLTHGVNDDLGGGIDSRQARPVALDTVATQCGFIAEALATGGADYPNPLWNLTTLVATFTEGGREDAHRMARGHAAYTEHDTDDLFDRKAAERDAKNLGWPKCQTVALNGCTACATCPHLAAGKSPLNLGRAAAPAPLPTGGDLPSGYMRNPDGRVWVQKTNDDGSTTSVLLCSYPMTDGWLQDGEPMVLNFTSEVVVGSKRQIRVPSDITARKADLNALLNRQGLMVSEREITNIKEFMLSWIGRLQQMRSAVVSATPFGWAVEGGKIDGFAYGGRVWGPKGDRPASSLHPVMAHQYGQVGEMQAWKDAVQLITDQKRPALDVIIASSFAAPLVKFTGHAGLLISAYSKESGIGKSTALRVAQAVWGDPIRGAQGLVDTQNSVVKKLGELRNLPLYWDELKSEDQMQKFVTMAFQLSGGKEKSRLNANAEHREVTTWETLLLSASNDSLMDTLAAGTKTTTAGVLRVFEYAVPPGDGTGRIGAGQATQKIAALSHNYGHAGLEYARWLGANWTKVQSEVAALQDALHKRASQEERFWVASIVVLLLGARYANQLGLTQIDEAAMGRFLLEQLDAMRKRLAGQSVDLEKAVNVVQILSQYLAKEQVRGTVYTDKVHRGTGKPITGTITVERDDSRIDMCNVHIATQDRLLRFNLHSFLDFLQKNKLGSTQLIRLAMKEKLGAREVNVRLAAGTPKATASMRCIECDLNHPELTGEFDF
jgi:hypothetical protein